MKAIKLASVFAVSAVAAAVSTSTLAAEPVFSGSAGVEYVSVNDGTNELSGTKEFEVEMSVDTGVVYAEIEIATDGEDEGTKIGMEKLYVKQGAVKFGRFDGTVATGSFMGMDEIYGGVDLETQDDNDTDNTGVRYSVTPELTVALEATNASGSEDGEIGAAFSYVADLGAFKAGISAGAVGESNAFNLGVQTTAGIATISANYGSGVQGFTGDTDVSGANVSVALAPTEALTLTLEFAKDLEGDEDTGTYFVGEYAAGDLIYYVKNYSGDLTTEQTKIGVKAEF